MKVSITSLYIISDAPFYDIIWTEKSDVIYFRDIEVKILDPSVLERSWTVRFIPSIKPKKKGLNEII